MGKYIFIMVAAMALSGCKTASINPICEAAKIAAAPISELVASPAVMACENPEALEAWMVGQLVEMKMCKSEPSAEGLIGMIICPKLADKLKSEGLKFLPADAKCQGGSLIGTGRQKFIEACIKIITI